MTDFPEWNAGEIVEEDVGEYLDARSARAAKTPSKARPLGRLPPKKDAKLSASPKSLVGLVPLVDCEAVDDELAGKGLGVPQGNLTPESTQLSTIPPRRPASPQSVALFASTRVTGAAQAPSAATRMTKSERPCEASTTDISAASRAGNAASSSRLPSSTVTLSNGTGRHSAALRNTDPHHLPSSTSRSRSGRQSNKNTTSPPAGCQSTDRPSTPSKDVSRVFSSRVSVSSGEGGTASECDSSIMVTATPLSAPAGMNLPLLQDQGVRARKNTLRKPFSAETPASLQAKHPSHTSLSAGVPGTRRPPSVSIDRAVSSDSTASNSSTRAVNRRSSFRGHASGTYATYGARIASNIAAPAPSGPLKNTTPVTGGLCASHSPNAVPSTSGQRTALHVNGNPGPFCGDYSYGGFFTIDGALDSQSKNSLAGTQSCTAVSRGASLTEYSVLRGAYDSYAHGLGKSSSSTALPHIGTALAPTIGDMHDSTAHRLSLPAVSGQRPHFMAPAAPQHPRPSRYSVPAGVMAARTHSFSSKRPISKPPTTRTKAPSAASSRVAGDKDNEVKEEDKENELNDSSDSLNADKHRKPVPHEKRALRRRGIDFDEV
ncbi:hypothetical protein CUR178_01207 [Leishmania enriettii]|uniref:Uncharacterized protein n=1 Tax=Leishmania enriettii TaxID=5663 RepID=A0A836H0A0_LEIEN|nr:hypothetical protein CUR178_01207 [Leishmania enriettii]